MFDNMLIYETMLYKKTMCTCMNNTGKSKGWCMNHSMMVIVIIYQKT